MWCDYYSYQFQDGDGCWHHYEEEACWAAQGNYSNFYSNYLIDCGDHLFARTIYIEIE